jgi:hypothetical protein
MFQSRRSLLVWKIFSRRLDGWTNDDWDETRRNKDITGRTWQKLRVKGAPRTRNARLRHMAAVKGFASQLPEIGELRCNPDVRRHKSLIPNAGSGRKEAMAMRSERQGMPSSSSIFAKS